MILNQSACFCSFGYFLIVFTSFLSDEFARCKSTVILCCFYLRGDSGNARDVLIW